jgi:hypothetical protein
MADVLEMRRRAVINWLGGREPSGETQTLKALYAVLVGPAGVFQNEAQAWAVISDLNDEQGSGHVRLIRGPHDFAYAVALTEKGRASYATLQRRWWTRVFAALAGDVRTIIVAAVTAVVATIATRLVERWLFP